MTALAALLPLLSAAPGREVTDLPYVVGKADPKQHLDLYVPTDPPPDCGYPVFVFVHGGGWSSGDRELYGFLGRALAKEQILTVIPSYRLVPGVKHPAQAQDVAAAFAWAQHHVAEYGGDPGKFVVGGHSAGGHLSSLVTLDRSYLQPAGGEPDAVRGVAGMSGVYDLARVGQLKLFEQTMLVPAFGADHSLWPAASPVTHIRGDAPPFWLNNAEIDWGLQRDAEAFELALRDGGVEVSRTMTPETNHITEIMRVGQPGDLTTARLLAFIRKVTGLGE